MQKKYFHNSIISFILIVSTILMPLGFLLKKAEAQNIAGYVSGLAPAIARLPQCQKAIGSGIKSLFNGIGDLLSDEIGGPIDDESDYGWGEVDSSKTEANDLDTKASSATIQVITPAVNSIEANRLQEKANKTLLDIKKQTEEINANSSCIASIGRLIAKMLLQKATKSTVNWINSGFDGNPAFIQDPGKFFNDIAKNEILQFGLEINNPELFPFGKAWQKNTAAAFKRKFQDNARYSLNELIQQTSPEFTAETFQQDFSQGGWDAWAALTQVPANNPLGFQIMADNEIQRRLAGTTQSTAQNVRDALIAADGFLGDERCIDAITGQINYGITKSDYQAYQKKTPPVTLCSSWEYVTPGKMISEYATQVTGYPNNALLNVQDLNDAVAAVLDATLNRFSASIYEKGFANIGYEGIDGVLVFSGTNSGPYQTQTEKDFIPSQLSSSWLEANPDFNIRTNLTQALIDEQRTYSDKLALQNKELSSTTDGQPYRKDVTNANWTFCANENQNCSFSGTQLVRYGANGIYFYKTATNGISCSNIAFDGDPIYGVEKTCNTTTDKVVMMSNAYGLIPAIYQLDYCIPGPHPGWENDSRRTLENIVLPLSKQAQEDTAGVVAKSVVSAGLNFVPYVGPVLSSIFGGLLGESEAEKASFNTRRHYADMFKKMTGYALRTRSDTVAIDLVDVNMSSSEGLAQSLNTILNRYIGIMKKTYFSSPDILPAVAQEAAKEFGQSAGYNQIMKDNNKKILSIKTTVGILGEIKDAVDNLNKEYKNLDGQFKSGKSEEEYESKLKTQINAFGRVSPGMVNGDDIANADDLAKQIVLKKNYVYKDLLKGTFGCEKDLEKPPKPFLSAGSGVKQQDDWSNYDINSVKRMTYPFPIIYDYNDFEAGALLPDPWNSGYTEAELPRMPKENMYDKYGPGFLSFVFFSNNTTLHCSTDGSNTCGPERLYIGDLVDTNDVQTSGSKYVPVGMSSQFNKINISASTGFVGFLDIFNNVAEPFETTIGIY